MWSFVTDSFRLIAIDSCRMLLFFSRTECSFLYSWNRKFLKHRKCIQKVLSSTKYDKFPLHVACHFFGSQLTCHLWETSFHILVKDRPSLLFYLQTLFFFRPFLKTLMITWNNFNCQSVSVYVCVCLFPSMSILPSLYLQCFKVGTQFLNEWINEWVIEWLKRM